MDEKQIAIENTLNLFTDLMSVEKIVPMVSKAHKVPMEHFDGARLMEMSMMPETSSNDLFFTDVTPDDLDEPLDVKFIKGVPDDKGNNQLRVARVRQVNPKKARGQISRIPKRLFEFTNGYFYPERKEILTAKLYIGLFGKRYMNLTTGKFEPLDEHMTWQMTLAASMQFTQQYQWMVYLKDGDAPEIGFPCDYQDLKEIFKLREVPPGKKRRQAIRTWISGHYRKPKQEKMELIKVRAHLRGQTKFNWNGLQVRIEPSKDDLKSLEIEKRPSGNSDD